MKNAWCRAALVLAAGALIPACGGSGGGGMGGLVLNLAGGHGTDEGGSGGDFELTVESIADGKILRSGPLNATFTTPTLLPDLGWNPEDVTVNTVWEVGDELGENDNYVTNGNGVTGVRVRPGVTLTVKPNFNPALGVDSVAAGTGVYTLDAAVPGWIFVGASLVIRDCANAANNGTFTVSAIAGSDITVNNAGSVVEAAGSFGVVEGLRDATQLSFSNAVIVEGTLVVDFLDQAVQGDSASHNRAPLTLYCYNLVVANGGRIVVSGRDNLVGTDGGIGGSFVLYSTGSVIVNGTIETAGGDGESGGAGGSLEIYPNSGNIYVKGTLDSSGGLALGANGTGGQGSTMYLYAGSPGGIFASGTLRSRGGNGPSGGGGAGSMQLYADESGGDAVSSGTLDASGGDATVDGDGGYGNQVYIGVYGGSLRVRGTVDVSGGDGDGDGDGGGAGSAYFNSDPSDDYIEYSYRSNRGVFIGANIHANGGTGVEGGSGGYVEASTNDFSLFSSSPAYSEPGTNPVVFVGYNEVRLSGGDGEFEGGNAGDATLINYGQYLRDTGVGNSFLSGGLRNEANIAARGGKSDVGQGGNGGNLEMYEYIDDEDSVPGGSVDRQVANSGRIDIGGGDGDEGGRAGDLYFYGFYHVVNTGAILGNGGKGLEQRGGYGAQLYLASDHRLDNSGSLSANGGDSVDGNGGSVSSYSNGIYLRAIETVSTGSLISNGGDSVNGDGGDSGYIEVVGGSVGSKVTGLVQSIPGTGGSDDGNRSSVIILGVLVQASNIP